MTSKPFILVDGSSYLFRAYYALPPLINRHGEPTGAIYGVLNMLKRLLKDYEPEHIAVIFDAKGKSFRHELYSQYKANRAAMPDELAVQIKPLHEMIRALGLPLVVEPGVEADDIIGTLAVQADQLGMPVVISTGDKDLAQLVNQRITLINTMTNQVLDTKGVEAKFGCRPDQMIDYLALVGDTSDNIPGVPMVGPKTAIKWIQQYGSLDHIIKAAAEIKGKVGENLRQHLSELALARELVTIKLDLQLQETPQSLVRTSPNNVKLRELFAHYEFKNWLVELGKDSVIPVPKAVNYRTLWQVEEVKAWLEKIVQHQTFAFDTETTSLDARAAELIGVSFALPNEAVYIPLAHDYADAPAQVSRDWMLQQLQVLFANSALTFIGQNIKYDLQVLANYGIAVHNQLIDTMVQAYVWHGTSRGNDLDSLAAHYLDHKTTTFEDIAGKGTKQKTFNQIEIDIASHYACEDAQVTYDLHQHFQKLFSENPALQTVLQTIDLPLVQVLQHMESQGVLLDASLLHAQSQALAKQLTALEQDVYALAGQEFNLGSPKQLQEILYNQLKLPILKKTPGGQPSTAEPVLQELALDYPLPQFILLYRTLSKLKSTYTDKLPLQVDAKTKRIHTSYNQAVTTTGRLSSNNPNLQNIPIRTEEGRKIRKAFIAPPGFCMLAADYSQIELRIIAHVSQDPGLLHAFHQGLDVHRATASEVFGVKLEAVTSEQRRHAKSINFGLLYGMSAFGLAKNLGISREDAQKYMNIYFERYPNVRAYMEKTVEFARNHGYVESLFGRRVYVPEINSNNAILRKAAERAAINAPMQSSAADIIKKAMLCVEEWILQNKLRAHMIMQVHDELVLEVQKDLVEQATKQVRYCMESACKLSVPLVVDVGIGANWDEAH